MLRLHTGAGVLVLNCLLLVHRLPVVEHLRVGTALYTVVVGVCLDSRYALFWGDARAHLYA